MTELCDQELINYFPKIETDHELKVRLALRMAGILPDDPEDGAEVLALTTSIYAVLTESRAKH